MRSKRSNNRLNLSSHAKVRSTRILKAWMVSLKNRLRPRLGRLRLRGFSGMLGDHARVENALAIRSGVKAAVEIDIGPSEVQTDLLGHLLQGFQTLGQQDHVRLIDGCHGEGRQ